MKKYLAVFFVFAFIFLSNTANAAGSLSIGATGGNVKVLQQILKNSGCYSGAIDGRYGRQTEKAVKECKTTAPTTPLSTSGVSGSTTPALSPQGLPLNLPPPPKFVLPLVPRRPLTNTNVTILSPGTISTCGEITQSGNYVLDRNLTDSAGPCLDVHDVSNVNIDCNEHTIEAQYPSVVNFSNVNGSSLDRCILIGSKYQHSLWIENSNNDLITDSTLRGSKILVHDSSNIKFSKNTLNVEYEQADSSGSIIENNSLINSSHESGSGNIYLTGGSNNIVRGNIIDGGSDGIMKGLTDSIGEDDGIILRDENNDVIENNTIKNIFDCGVETIGLIANSKIIGNNISNAGVSGIGGWYFSSFKANLIENNKVDNSVSLFLFDRAYGLRTQNFNDGYDKVVVDTEAYFKDNNFTNNKLSYPKTSLFYPYSAITINPSSGPDNNTIPLDWAHIITGNNLVTGNDFTTTVPLALEPTSMIIDGGGNICLPYVGSIFNTPQNIGNYSLNCSGNSTKDKSHPADTNKDFRITIDELTAYASIHRNDQDQTLTTSATNIWRNGETYRWDGMNWVPIVTNTLPTPPVTNTPQIDSLSPSSGSAGTSVFVNGSALSTLINDIEMINFGNYSFSVDNGCKGTPSITCFTVPKKVIPAVVYPVSLTNANGTSNTVNFYVGSILNAPSGTTYSNGTIMSTPLTITTTSPLVPDATVGDRYYTQFKATGGISSPIPTWSTADSVPGLALDQYNGNFSGTPTAPGNYSITIQITSGSQTISKLFALTVNSAITHPADTNGDLRITIDELTTYGLLLTKNKTKGMSPYKEYLASATIIWQNGEAYHWNSGRQDWLPTKGLVIMTDSPLPNATVGQSYSANINFSESPAYFFVMFNLPSGLTYDSCGVGTFCAKISGTPTKPESKTVTVRVSTGSGGQDVSKDFILTVNPAIPSGNTYSNGTVSNNPTPTPAPTPVPTPASNLAPAYNPQPTYTSPSTATKPHIDYLSASTAPINTPVTIYGSNLPSEGNVYFNNGSIAYYTGSNGTTATFTVPARATIGQNSFSLGGLGFAYANIYSNTVYLQVTSGTNLTQPAPTPTPTPTFTPPPAPPAPTSTNPDTNTQIVPTPSSGPGVSSATTPGCVPAVTSVSPASGPVGSQFTVNGTCLSGSTIYFNVGGSASPVSCSGKSDSTLTCLVPNVQPSPFQDQVYAHSPTGGTGSVTSYFLVTGQVQGASIFNFWQFLISLFK